MATTQTLIVSYTKSLIIQDESCNNGYNADVTERFDNVSSLNLLNKLYTLEIQYISSNHITRKRLINEYEQLSKIDVPITGKERNSQEGMVEWVVD